jgi:hypothetical protein
MTIFRNGNVEEGVEYSLECPITGEVIKRRIDLMQEQVLRKAGPGALEHMLKNIYIRELRYNIDIGWLHDELEIKIEPLRPRALSKEQVEELVPLLGELSTLGVDVVALLETEIKRRRE